MDGEATAGPADLVLVSAALPNVGARIVRERARVPTAVVALGSASGEDVAANDGDASFSELDPITLVRLRDLVRLSQRVTGLRPEEAFIPRLARTRATLPEGVLTATQQRVFVALIAVGGRILSAADLERTATGGRRAPETLRTHVCRINAKLAEHRAPVLIESVRGQGYRLRDRADDAPHRSGKIGSKR